MADIFISYSKAEREVTDALARDLEAVGYSVWWDTSLIPGDLFKDVILDKIVEAKAAIVIWTKTSVKSDWVYSEASRAKAQGKLVPLRSADVTTQDIPPPFDAIHTELVTNMHAVTAGLARLGVVPALERTEGAAKASGEGMLPLPTERSFRRRERLNRMQAEEEHWNLIKKSNDRTAFQAFIEQNPQSSFASAARARIAQLDGQGATKPSLVLPSVFVVALALIGGGAWLALNPIPKPVDTPATPKPSATAAPTPVVASVKPGTLPPDIPKSALWGAVAARDGNFTAHWKFTSKQEASDAALAACRKLDGASECEVVASFTSRWCWALARATSERSKWNWSTGSSIESARNAAMSACEKKVVSEGCAIALQFCSDGANVYSDGK